MNSEHQTHNYFLSQSESGCDYLRIYDGNYHTDPSGRNLLKSYDGVKDIDYEINAEVITIRWSTDSSVAKNPMTAFIDF